MSEKTEQSGHIFQVMGAVVDVKFDSLDDLPNIYTCLLYTSPSPRDSTSPRMPSSA